jgi:hypothetical protein
MSGQYNVSPTSYWHTDSITVATSDPGATGRDYATVEALANAVLIKPRGGAKQLILRFRTDSSNNDTNVLQIYAARGADDYCKIAQLTITQGQQIDSGSIYFCDTITPASEDALFDGEESNITDMIGHYLVRTLGFDRFAVIVTTLNSTTVHVDWAMLFETV